ncbi:unnamed protein product [Meloidogyne enterolobii]|uniref:Uncharacterized protein n=1 Tax=Meloidogyne enterolobii TaxID=390850 RepID=A0ACB0YLW3_MELEN
MTKNPKNFHFVEIHNLRLTISSFLYFHNFSLNCLWSLTNPILPTRFMSIFIVLFFLKNCKSTLIFLFIFVGS